MQVDVFTACQWSARENISKPVERSAYGVHRGVLGNKKGHEGCSDVTVTVDIGGSVVEIKVRESDG
jgi:hypothetical protein